MDIIKWPKSALYVIIIPIIVWSQYQSLVKKHLSLNTMNYVALAYASFQLIGNSGSRVSNPRSSRYVDNCLSRTHKDSTAQKVDNETFYSRPEQLPRLRLVS
jgi:hypothetical protein